MTISHLALGYPQLGLNGRGDERCRARGRLWSCRRGVPQQGGLGWRVCRSLVTVGAGRVSVQRQFREVLARVAALGR